MCKPSYATRIHHQCGECDSGQRHHNMPVVLVICKPANNSCCQYESDEVSKRCTRGDFPTTCCRAVKGQTNCAERPVQDLARHGLASTQDATHRQHCKCLSSDGHGRETKVHHNLGTQSSEQRSAKNKDSIANTCAISEPRQRNKIGKNNGGGSCHEQDATSVTIWTTT